jgi:hypothetical protein
VKALSSNPSTGKRKRNCSPVPFLDNEIHLIKVKKITTF